ncbi:MAG TPA: hypothetical protein VGL70_17065 [Candidatus Binatia bacterium]
MLLTEAQKKIFLHLPVYTPTLLALTDPAMTALVLRVDSLQSFKQKRLRLQVAIAGYEHDGSHLACVAFRVYDNEDNPLEGDANLNPRQESDRKALDLLTRQDRLPFIFLSADLVHSVDKTVSWQPASRAAAQEVFDHSKNIGLLSGSFDPEFQRAKDHFQSLKSVKDLLALK